MAELAERLQVSPTQVIKYLMTNGVMATMNQSIDYETAALAADHFGFEAESEEAVKLLFSDLAKIGLTPNQGYFGPKVLDNWKSSRGKLQQVRQLDAAELRSTAGKKSVQIVDVRGPDEWRRGHLRGAIHIPLAALPDRIGELNSAGPIVVHCKGGSRAAIAASFLQAGGISNVSSLVEGYDGWVKRGFEVE